MKRMACLIAAILAASCGHRPPDLPRIESNLGVTLRVDTSPGHGTGIVVSQSGHILTCLHVVAEAKTVTVVVSEGGKPDVAYPAEVLSPDVRRGLVLLKIPRRFERTVVFEDPESVHYGDPVYTVGFPYDLGRTVWRGSIARMNARFRGLSNMLMLDIQDGHGTSGAGIYSAASGKVVGLMYGMLWRDRFEPEKVKEEKGPLTTMRAAVVVDDLLEYLRQSGIRYRTYWPDEHGAHAAAPIRIAIVVTPR